MDSHDHIAVGDTIIVMPSGYVGVVRFIGLTKFARGNWVGVELNSPDGKNDGAVKGTRYFDCQDGYGLFARPGNVSRVRNEQVRNMARSKSARRLVSGHSRSESTSSQPTAVLGSLNPDLAAAVVDYENMAMLRILVEEDGKSALGVDKLGNSCLHIVAKHGGGKRACRVLQYLLDHGLHRMMHVRNIYGATAAMVAAREKRWMEMEYLVSRGADVIHKGPNDSLPSPWESSYYNLDGRQALHRGMEAQKRARQDGQLNVPKMRHKYSTLIEALFRTAHAGDMKYVRMLLEERDMNVNSTDQNGNNCLHWIASDHKRLPIIKYLVAMGARMEAKNKDGETPAMIAARTRAWAVMRYLVSMGASVTDKDLKGNTVFSHSRVCEASRNALRDGLAEKHENNLTDIDGGDELTHAQNAYDHDREDELEDDDDEDDEDNGAYRNVEEVQAELREATVAESSDDAGSKSAGKFSGMLFGRKKDRAKCKVCMVTVSEESIMLSYQKGAWFNRGTLVEEYAWSDAMQLAKVGDDKLEVVLDAANGVKLHIQPCHPDSVEEFIWIHIWKSVFEVSVREAKQLLVEYETFCRETEAALAAAAERQEQVQAQLGAAHNSSDANDDEVDSLTREADQIDREIGDLLSRFGNIRQQGETLRDTFEKMHEALERRYTAEQLRHTECVNKQQNTKAAQLKADMDKIRAQMDVVHADKQRVAEMYEHMKQQELTYSHFGQEDYW